MNGHPQKKQPEIRASNYRLENKTSSEISLGYLLTDGRYSAIEVQKFLSIMKEFFEI